MFGNIFKSWWTSLIVIMVVITAVGCSSTNEATSPSGQKANEQTTKSATPESKKITLAEYESIKTGDALTGKGGMTYEEVVAKFGEPSNKSESQSGNFKVVMASWTENINGDLGANFNVTFMNGKASGKAQMGMK